MYLPLLLLVVFPTTEDTTQHKSMNTVTYFPPCTCLQYRSTIKNSQENAAVFAWNISMLIVLILRM